MILAGLMLFLAFMLTAGASISSSQPAVTENAEVELISENETIQPGELFPNVVPNKEKRGILGKVFPKRRGGR